MKVLEKTFLHSYFEKFDAVPFTVSMADGEDFSIGDGRPLFHVVVHKAPSKADLLQSTSLALGEAYMNGDLEIEGDLYTALDLFLGQISKFDTDMGALKKLLHPGNSMRVQKSEVCSHYDIGNDFYSLWLDKTLSYSCGYFKQDTDTLYDAQVNKVHHILKKLHLKQGMSLVDIGCGWGFLLLEAAKKYKVSCVGITLSEQQARKFHDRIEEEGLQNLVQVKILDYRKLPSLDMKFDRAVSVGMLEHVGRENYGLFMETVQKVLKPEGLFLLHYISALTEHPGDAWIKKYIFPGGVIPSLREMIDICGDLGFYTLDVESLRRHYTKTLLCWHENFEKHKAEVRSMFDEKFVRMWELYLCSCAATFHNGIIDLYQILLSNGVNNDLPMTRKYLYQD